MSIALVRYTGGKETPHTIICASAILCYNDMALEKTSRGTNATEPRLSVRVSYRHSGTARTEIFDLERFFAKDNFIDSTDPITREKLKLDSRNDALYLIGFDSFMDKGKPAYRAPYFICHPDSLNLFLATRIPHMHYVNYVNNWDDTKIKIDDIQVRKGTTLSTTPLQSSK